MNVLGYVEDPLHNIRSDNDPDEDGKFTLLLFY